MSVEINLRWLIPRFTSLCFATLFTNLTKNYNQTCLDQIPSSEHNFHLNVQTNPKFHWFCFTSLHNWSRKLAPLTQTIGQKLKPLRTWLHLFSLSLIYSLVVFPLISYHMIHITIYHFQRPYPLHNSTE